jgi:hypothetical protein
MFRSFSPVFAALLTVMTTPGSFLGQSPVRVDVKVAIDSFVNSQVAKDGSVAQLSAR